MNVGRRNAALVLMGVFLVSLAPIQAEGQPEPSFTITTHWVGEGTTDVAHAYLLTFSDNGTYTIDVTLHHERNGTFLSSTQSIVWGSQDGLRTALVSFNTSLEWGDIIEIDVNILSHNGDAVDISGERTMIVGRWNQPMDDHEVMLSTTWGICLLYTSPSPRDLSTSRMPSSA